MKILKYALMALMSAGLGVIGLNAERIKGEKMQISLHFSATSGGETIVITLEDNVAARDFYAMLPLELNFSDYVGKEKISKELPQRLNTTGLKGYNPSVGDFFYFAPWGNLGIFYEKQPFHSGLVFLGRVSARDLAKIRAA